MVQNFDRGGNRGTLNVFGSIAEKYRGRYTNSYSGSTGYPSKNWDYDPKLAKVTPPKFINPVASTYDIVQYAETNTSFAASGAPQ
ncbi:hypothetical protein ACDF64_01420 [Agromyces sp. MMS24-JH15]|uniref:hypothetical protein n=1 Tax=Agromyces sp. MMS24-JH15 TaxID=3243765 RepID=UPI0037486A00